MPLFLLSSKAQKCIFTSASSVNNKTKYSMRNKNTDMPKQIYNYSIACFLYYIIWKTSQCCWIRYLLYVVLCRTLSRILMVSTCVLLITCSPTLLPSVGHLMSPLSYWSYLVTLWMSWDYLFIFCPFFLIFQKETLFFCHGILFSASLAEGEELLHIPHI